MNNEQSPPVSYWDESLIFITFQPLNHDDWFEQRFLCQSHCALKNRLPTIKKKEKTWFDIV